MSFSLRCVLPGLMLFAAAHPVVKSADIWYAAPKPVQASSRTSLTPTVDGTPMASNGGTQSLDNPRTQGVVASTTLLNGALSTETEIAANRSGPAGEDPSGHMMRLGIVGSSRFARYGITYRTADQAFAQTPGQEQREAWGEWNTGAMSVRSLVGQRSRLQADAGGARLDQQYNRIDVAWNTPVWPRLGVSYVHNAPSTTTNTATLFPQTANGDRVEAAIGYGGAMWDATLASAIGTETDLNAHGTESRVQTETLTTSLRPSAVVTITPSVGYRVEQQTWSGTKMNSPSASLSMKYQQSAYLSMTAMGNYFSTRSSDKLVDIDMVGGKGVVTWELEPLREWKPQVQLEGGYNLQVNRLMPSPQNENFSGMLRLVLATM
jgi:hypothetical protein